MMQTSCIWFLMAMLSAVLGECKDSVALMFSREIVLRGVGDVTLDSSFNTLAETCVNDAIKPRAVTTNSFVQSSNVVIVATAWLRGDPEEAQKSVNELNAIFNTWGDTPNPSLVAKLNELSLLNLGRQPSLVDFKDNCSYGDESMGETSSGFCSNNLTLIFSMRANPENKLVQELCRVFAMPHCFLITLDSSGMFGSYFVAQVTIISPDVDLLLVKLINHVRYASPLVAESIISIESSGVRLYTQPGNPIHTFKGTTASCLSHYWYLIFLLLLLPIVLIVGQRVRYCGEESGKKSIRDMEWDIRSGVRYRDRMRASVASRNQFLCSANQGPYSPRNQYAVHNPQFAYWQNVQEPQQLPQQAQGQDLYYDPNAMWQYGGEEENQQYHTTPMRS